MTLLATALLASPLRAQAPLRSTVFPQDSARIRKGPTNQRSLVDTLTAILTKLEMHETTLAPGQSRPLDVLAAAEAESGRFDLAQRDAAGAIELAKQRGLAASAIEARLARYREQQPWREDPAK